MEHKPPEKLLLKSNEASQMLGISERTLWGLGKQRKIPVVKIGRATRYDIADIKRFIEQAKGASLIEQQS